MQKSRVQSPDDVFPSLADALISRLCCVKPSSACLLPPKEFEPPPPISYNSQFLSSFFFFFFFLLLHPSPIVQLLPLTTLPQYFFNPPPHFGGVSSANLSRASVDKVQDCTQAFDPSPIPREPYSRPVSALFEAIATFTIHNVSFSSTAQP